jgi:hypothetical protein
LHKIEEFVDERQKSWCIHCARPLADLETNEDHVPSKGLLAKPRPHHLPIVTICKECNTSFSLDEQYVVTFLSCVLASSTDPEKQSNASAARALADSTALRARIERSRTEYVTHGGETRVLWKPDSSRVERVVLKNARGTRISSTANRCWMLRPGWRLTRWKCMTTEERQDFEGLSDQGSLAAWPEVGSRMLTRLLTGEDTEGEWVVVQEGIYRYSVQQDGGLRVRSVLSEYLATEVQWEH